MAKLGFLGLGIMGYPMARNLLQAGHDVALWSNTSVSNPSVTWQSSHFSTAIPSWCGFLV